MEVVAHDGSVVVIDRYVAVTQTWVAATGDQRIRRQHPLLHAPVVLVGLGRVPQTAIYEAVVSLLHDDDRPGVPQARVTVVVREAAVQEGRMRRIDVALEALEVAHVMD